MLRLDAALSQFPIDTLLIIRTPSGQQKPRQATALQNETLPPMQSPGTK